MSVSEPSGRDSFFGVAGEEAIHSCSSVLISLNRDLGFEAFDVETLSFDLIFSFLLPHLPVDVQFELASRLALFRRLIESYSQEGPADEQGELKELLRRRFGISAISREAYAVMVSTGRLYVGSDLLASYVLDTRRVFYRFDIVREVLGGYPCVNSLLEALRLLSAYLLFDDDIYDLEEDLAVGKSTILIEYLAKPQNNLRKAVDEMKAILPSLERVCMKGSPLLAFARSLAMVHSG